MSRLTDRLERDLREIAAGADPSPSAWESIVARLDEDAGLEVVVVPALDAKVASRRLRSAVAAAAVVVIAGSIALRIGIDDDQAVSTAELPDVTTRYVSERNGFSVGYVDRGAGTITPATDSFGMDLDGFDIIEAGSSAEFGGTSTVLLESNGLCFDGDGEPSSCPSIEEAIEQHLVGLFGGCGVPRSPQAEITIDGRSGGVVECTNRIEATVRTGGRLYIFTLWHERDDARAVFDAFVATIELTPETAVDFPNLTHTFVSPTYGYSFGSIDRGGDAPATTRWDPGNQPVEDVDFDQRLDGVETGFGAYLEGASTPVPDGVPIDDWVDQYVTPRAAGGCGVPRSQQAEVVIDGRSGRAVECSDQVEATVVAGGRLYLFTLYRSSRDARAMFDTWIGTIDLTPETAAVP